MSEHKNDFSLGEQAQIKDLARNIVPEEQKKCTAYKIFSDKDNEAKFFDSFNDIKNVIKEVQEHKKSHDKLEMEVGSLKKMRWINRSLSLIGAGMGAFAAIILRRKLEG